MKKSSLLLHSILACCFLHAQKTTIDLSDKVSIDFPAEPAVADGDNGIIYRATAHAGLYSVEVIDVSEKIPSENFSARDLKEFYDGFFKRMADSFRNSIKRKRETLIDGYPALEIHMKTDTGYVGYPCLFQTFLLVGQYFFILKYHALEESDFVLQNKDIFFNSVKINTALSEEDLNNKNQSSESTNSPAISFAENLGGLLFIIVILFFIIRWGIRSTRKSSENTD